MNSPHLKGISVVVPVHNETGNVEKLAGELSAVTVEGVDFEFVFVDDCSSDDTVEKLKALKAQESRIVVLEHIDNHGQSAALRSGVRAARYEWVCTIDGDGQNDPADIPKLVACARNIGPMPHTILVSGNRRQKRQDSFVRRLSSVVANGIRSKLLKDSTPDSGCGLKLISREGFLALPYFDHMHRFLPSLVLRDGGEVHSIPVNHRPRLEGKSHYGIANRLWVGIVDIMGVMWLHRRSSVPRTKSPE